MRGRSVVVTGMGIVSAIGCGAERVWRSMERGASGIGRLSLFPSERCGDVPVAEVREDLAALGAPARSSRNDQMAFLAGQEALAGAGLSERDAERLRRSGVVLGATVGGMLCSESFAEHLVRNNEFLPMLVRYHEVSSSVDVCAGRFGLFGPCVAVSTACSSSALAVAIAARAIEAGDVDAMLAGGADSLCRLTLHGFHSLLLLDPAGCRPFDASRSGLSLGEGAGVMVLEDEETARGRGAPILARLSGWGTTCDAHHVTAPEPEGKGALDAMRAALSRAGLPPRAIGYVNAHGTGTRDNDLAEARALKALFGPALPPISSTKGFFGHALGGSGAIEAVVSVMALRRGRIPPNIGFRRADPDIGFEPAAEFRDARLDHVLSSSFGFGGNNVALVFSTPDAETPIGSGHRRPSATPASGVRRQDRFAVVGMGVVSPAGATPADVCAARRRGVEPAVLEIGPPLPPARIRALTCPDSSAKEELDANRRRRLNRLQQMALVAAKRCFRDAGGRFGPVDPGRLAVAIGTGLGCLHDTSDFLMNLMVGGGKTPMPAKFVRSVHNALSSEVAIELGARGMNSAPTQSEISFEAALWQGTHALASGEADLLLAGAGDELSPYVLALGLHWRWWPGADGEKGRPEGPLPGEGAAVVALADSARAQQALAHVRAVRVGRALLSGRRLVDAKAEARWIEDALSGSGIRLSDVDLVLTGAAGVPGMDAAYDRVLDAIDGRLDGRVARGRYKRLCGSHPSASAFGFIVAVGLVRGEIRPEDVQAGDGSAPCRRPGRVLLYTLGRGGEKGMCVVEP